MYLDVKVASYYNSDTPRPYSQLFNPVNYWLMNNYTAGVTSFGTCSQFDFNDVNYHIGNCNVDTRRCNVVFTTFELSKRISAYDGLL